MSDIIKTVIANQRDEILFLDAMKSRSGEINAEVTKNVSEIIENVRINGDKALDEYGKRFDNCAFEGKPVSADEIERAYRECPKELVKALEKAAENISEYHKKQLRQGFEITKDDGVLLGQKIVGLNRVGVYVPGGTAAYPSSVLMNVIPAKIAGVKEIVMITPPQKDEQSYMNILAAARVSGVDKIFLVGGAHGAAALAYGTESIPKVDKIVGPGNIYVATAKKLLFGIVDIDMVAGPSEILILADQTANPKYIAADLMSQAEHDVLASSILLTTSQNIVNEVVLELEKQSETLSRKEIIRKSLKDFGAIIVFDDTDKMINYANQFAPEHLEVCLENPIQYLDRLYTAGSVFLGDYSPEPLGDYYAGPNHVLPTSGTARFFSPLGVDSFIKKYSYISYTKQAFDKAKSDIITLAESEGLTAHANSARIRE